MVTGHPHDLASSCLTRDQRCTATIVALRLYTLLNVLPPHLSFSSDCFSLSLSLGAGQFNERNEMLIAAGLQLRRSDLVSAYPSSPLSPHYLYTHAIVAVPPVTTVFGTRIRLQSRG